MNLPYNDNLPPAIPDPAEDLTDIQYKECVNCDGAGNYEEDVCGDGGSRMTVDCEYCEGTGKVPMTIEEIEAEREASKEPNDL